MATDIFGNELNPNFVIPQRPMTAQRPSPQTKQKKKGNLLTSLLPSLGGIAGGVGGGALGGAAAGSAILPGLGTAAGGLIGALIGGATGGAAGKVAENKVEGTSLTSGVGKEALLNGVFSAGPLRLGKAAVDTARGVKAGAGLAEALSAGGQSAKDMSLSGLLGKKLTDSGTNLIAKEFRLNPTQQANFKNLHGEEATAVLRRYKVKSPEDIQSRINPLQDAFDNVITQIPNVSRDGLETGLKKIYEPLQKSPALFEKNLGEQIKAQSEELLKVPKTKSIIGDKEPFSDSAFHQNFAERAADAISNGGKNAKAVTRAMLNGAPKDAVGIFKSAIANSPNKSEIRSLVESIAPELEGNAKNKLVSQLVDVSDPNDVAKNIWDAIATGRATSKVTDIPASKINDMRKTFDAAVHYTQKGAPEYNVIKKTADALRGTLHTAADSANVKTADGMSFKEVGKELRKLYGLDDVVGKQSYLGSGTLPVSLPNLLGGAAGGAAGGLPGAALGTVGTAVINSNAGRRAITDATLKLGDGLSALGEKKAANALGAKAIAKRIAPLGLADALGQSLGNSTQQTTDTSMMMPTNNMINQLSPDVNDLSTPQPEPQSSPYDIANIETNVQHILQNGGSAKDVESYLSIASAINDMKSKALSTGAGKPLNSTAAGVVADTQTGLSALDGLSGALSSSNANSPLLGGLRAMNPFDTGAQSLQAQVATAKQLVGKALEGGVLRKEDEAKYAKLLPTMRDTDSTAQFKIQQLQQLISSRLNVYLQSMGSGGGGTDQQTLAAALGV